LGDFVIEDDIKAHWKAKAAFAPREAEVICFALSTTCSMETFGS